MNLEASPNNDFDIHEVESFQGMYEMSYSQIVTTWTYSSKLKEKRRTSEENLMLAENLPDIFSIEVTEDYGASVSASGNGGEIVP